MGKHGGVGYEDDKLFVKIEDSCLASGLKYAFKGGVIGAYTYYVAEWIIFVTLLVPANIISFVCY